MKCKGELKNICLDYVSKKPEITVQLDANAEDLETLEGKELSVELKPWRNKRSLDANGYYWALCTQIAKALNQPEPVVHNILLRRYGQPYLVEGKAVLLVLPDTDEGEQFADNAETYHIKPTSEVKQGNDGRMYRTYKLLKGSHEYDTAEMAQLIDGTITEAKALGIETLTENQKREMMAAYEKYHAGH